MTTAAKQKCSERVYINTWQPNKPCARDGKVERDGQWFCKQHDPEAVRARGEAKAAEFRAKISNEVRRKEVTERILQAAYTRLSAEGGEPDPEMLYLFEDLKSAGWQPGSEGEE